MRLLNSKRLKKVKILKDFLNKIWLRLDLEKCLKWGYNPCVLVMFWSFVSNSPQTPRKSLRKCTETYHKTAKVVVFSPDFLQSWYSRWSDLWSWFLLCSNRGHLEPLIFRCSVGITHPQHLQPGPYGQKFLPKINAFSSLCPTWEKCSLLPVEISDGNNGRIFEKFRLRRCVLHLQTLAKLKNSWLWFRMKTSCRR